VHEGGYAIEDDPAGGLRFRNRHGVLCPGVPRSPPGSAAELIAQNERRGRTIGAQTNRHGYGDALDLRLAVCAVERAVGLHQAHGGDAIVPRPLEQFADACGA
jgi:hypothetical protein